jgi:hypothetical protein
VVWLAKNTALNLVTDKQLVLAVRDEILVKHSVSPQPTDSSEAHHQVLLTGLLKIRVTGKRRLIQRQI